MESRRKKYSRRLAQTARMALLIVGAICLAAASPVAARAAAGARTMIFVIDSSENMAPHLSSALAAISITAGDVKAGSTLGIISCSDTATKLVVRKISNPRDLGSVTSRLNTIEPEGDVSDIAAGVARALGELGQLRRRGDRDRKGIIVIAASQSPDKARAEKTLRAALTELDEHLPRREWYIQYCYLDGVVDSAVESFVSSNHGVSYDIDRLTTFRYSEPVEEFERVFSSPSKMNPPRIVDLSGAILGKDRHSDEWVPLRAGSEISQKMRLRVASNSRAVIALGTLGRLGLAPETHLTLTEATINPLSDKSRFSVKLEAGSVWMNLHPKSSSIFKLAAAGIEIQPLGGFAQAEYSEAAGELNLTSFSDLFLVKLSDGKGKPLRVRKDQAVRLAHDKMVGEAEPAEPEILEKWKSWKNALAGKAALSTLKFSIPEVIFPDEAISLGPIKSRGTQSLDYAVRIVGIDDPSLMRVAVKISLELPEGLSLSTSLIDGQRADLKILKLRLDGAEGFQSRRSEEHTGTLWILPSEESEVVFDKIVVPITVTTEGPAAPMSILYGAGAVILLVLVALAVGKLLRARNRMVARPHAVIGRLIVVNDPTGGRIGTINLEVLSTKSSRLSLTIGKDKASEVRLRHTSVKAAHCVLETYLAAGRLETYIIPLDSARLTVGGENIKSKTHLLDGVRIEIGDFIYQFEDSQMYKKVEIVRRNGRRTTGILDTSGMDAAGFTLSPMDAVSPSERARVKFSDIRSATFYRRVVDILSGSQRSLPKPDTMKRVELMFKKGNTISGYIQREYVEGRRRYVELLPLEIGSDIDYTIIDYSAVVEKTFL